VALSGNGLFDPGLSLSSNQAVGFDYWASMYERYRVIGSHIQVNLSLGTTATSGSVATQATVTVFPATANASLATQSDANAQPYATVRDATTQTPTRIQKTMKTSIIAGLKAMEGADQLQALVSGTPSNEWFWNIGITSNASTTDHFTEFDIVVTYDVEFFDRAQINRSTMDFIHRAYLSNCLSIEAKYQDIAAQREKARAKYDAETKQLRSEFKIPHTDEHPGQSRRPLKAEYKEDQYVYVPEIEEAHFPLLSRLQHRPSIRPLPINTGLAVKDAPPQTPSKKA
jgi:hypothetical protein